MAVINVNESTVGAPNSGRMSGTAGDLYSMLKYALPLNGWAVEYDDAANFRAVFRPGTGNRFRLFIADNATDSGDARVAIVRGCENASAATLAGIIDPFPTVAAVANTSANWAKSTAASTTARSFDIWVGTTWVIFACNSIGTTNAWEFNVFGDTGPNLSGDSYGTICTVRQTALGVTANFNIGAAPATIVNRVWWCRSYDGTQKSTAGSFWSGGAAGSIGAIASYPAAQGGPTVKIDGCKALLSDGGTAGSTAISSSTGLPQRGWFPNLWIPQHSGPGSVNTRDIWGNTAYNASSSFSAIRNSNGAGGWVFVETSDTWVKPSV